MRTYLYEIFNKAVCFIKTYLFMRTYFTVRLLLRDLLTHETTGNLPVGMLTKWVYVFISCFSGIPSCCC